MAEQLAAFGGSGMEWRRCIRSLIGATWAVVAEFGIGRNLPDQSLPMIAIHGTAARRRTSIVWPISMIIASSPNSTAPA